MEWGLATALALVAVVAAWILGRNRGARQVAESSGALAAAEALARDGRERLERLQGDLAARHDQIASLSRPNSTDLDAFERAFGVRPRPFDIGYLA